MRTLSILKQSLDCRSAWLHTHPGRELLISDTFNISIPINFSHKPHHRSWSHPVQIFTLSNNINYSSTNSIRKVVISRPSMIRYLQIPMFVNWICMLVNSQETRPDLVGPKTRTRTNCSCIQKIPS